MQNADRRRRQRQKETQAAGKEVAGSPVAAASAGYDAAMVEHIRMATELFEGRKVSRREVLEMLAAEEKRQQGIGEEEKLKYHDGSVNENSS